MTKDNQSGFWIVARGVFAEILFAIFLGLLGCGAFTLSALIVGHL